MKLHPHRNTVVVACLLGVSLLAGCGDRAAPTGVNDSGRHLSPLGKQFSFTALSTGTLREVLAPQTVTRNTGAPFTTNFVLAGAGPSAVLHVKNGDASGNHRATSGSITLDGVQVVGASSFKKSVASFDVALAIGNPSTIGVQLQGAPGSTVTISVDAELATSGTVTSAGGNIVFLGGQVQLSVPAGALGSTTILTATPVAPPTPDVIPGTAIDFGPSGTTFGAPVTITIAYDPSTLPLGVRPAYLEMKWWNVDHWEALANNSVDVVHSTVSATTTHFSIYALLPNGREFCPGDVTAESDFQTAINDAPAGGNLWVCNGSFTVAGILGKALAIRAENPGLATLAQNPAATGTEAILLVQGVASGMVSIQGMTFAYTAVGLRTLDFDSLSVTGTTFAGPVVAPSVQAFNAVRVDPTGVAPHSVLYDHNTFFGGGVALTQQQPVNTVMTNNNFHDMGAFAMAIYTASSISVPLPPGGTPIMRGSRIEFNSFTNCGTGVCIALEASGADTVRHNIITMSSGNVNDGIFIFRGGVPLALTQPAIITDNSITGHAAIGDPNVQTNWGITGAIVENGGPVGVVDVVERNQINTAYIGIQMRFNTSAMNLTDNTLAHMHLAMQITSVNNVMNAHRNDISDYVTPMATGAPPFSAGIPPLGSSSVTCNWWGNASGPQSVVPGTDAAKYTPFATTPIANMPAVVCP